MQLTYNDRVTTLLSLILLIVLSLVGVSPSRAAPSPLEEPLGQREIRVSEATIVARDEPSFPNQPPSCPICAQSYDNINSCAQAAPVLANVSMIIFNPSSFVDVIKCACTETFQSAYPQCVDCFQQTNQTDLLSAPGTDLSSVVSGVRSICAIASTLLGGVATADGEVTPTNSIVPPSPTAHMSSALAAHIDVGVVTGIAVLAGIFGIGVFI